MKRVKRPLQRSLDSLHSPEKLQRREEEIAKPGSRLKKFCLSAMHNTTVRYPRLVANVANLEDHTLNPNFLDSGYQSTVYKIDDETVLKVEKKSKSMTPRERARYAGVLEYEHQQMADYIGKFVVPHNFSVGPDPFDTAGSPAVLITQEFKALNFLELCNPASLKTMLAGSEQTLSALGGVLVNSRKMYSETDLAPDLLGVRNMGIDPQSGGLAIVNSQPANIRDERGLRMLPANYDRLDGILQQVAAQN